MIGLLVVDAVLIFCICMLGVGLLYHSKRLDLINEEVEDWIADTRELKQRCDGHKELIEALSKSVRELNGVVEAAVKVKEETSDNKPDTKALIGGWNTDDAETTWLDDILAKIRKEEAKPIDASHISTGMIDGKSLMNCELPNISDSTYEKICELFEVKVPEEEKHADATHIGIGVGDGQTLAIPVRDTGRVLMHHGKTVANHWHGRLWTNSEGRIYELPEGCFVLGDTPYEMDQ